MKHVLIFKFPYASQLGGGEMHTFALVEGLSKLGYSFTLVATCPVLLGEFKKRHWPARRIWAMPEPVAKWSLILFPFLAIPMWLVLVGNLIYYRIRFGTRLVYCLSLTEKILAVIPARLLGMRVVWAEHVGFKRWLSLNPLKIFYQWNARWVTIIVISMALKQQLIAMGIPAKRIQVIYNGFDFQTFEHNRTPYRPPTADRFIVGTVCRLEKEKGVEYLLLAAQKILPLIPQLRIVVVGDGSERKRLEWLAKNLELDAHTQFVGYQGQPIDWIRDFDVYALPSVGRESFGRTLVEALALDRPVVASEIEGTSEIVKQMQTGLLVTPGDSEELAQAILYYYQHPEAAHRLAVAGREWVTQQFSMEQMLSQFYQTFESLI
ncbi:MAG: glycosyltransferase family 4 protein [Patescibacteria group bacterium]|jgi:glycosyltransferase involved in cell wall biosynthesis